MDRVSEEMFPITLVVESLLSTSSSSQAVVLPPLAASSSPGWNSLINWEKHLWTLFSGVLDSYVVNLAPSFQALDLTSYRIL